MYKNLQQVMMNQIKDEYLTKDEWKLLFPSFGPRLGFPALWFWQDQGFKVFVNTGILRLDL